VSRIIRDAAHDCPPAPQQLILIITLRLQSSPSHHAFAACCPKHQHQPHHSTRRLSCSTRNKTQHRRAPGNGTATKKPSATPVSSHIKQKPFHRPIFRSHSLSLQLVAWHCETASPTLAASPRENAMLIPILIIPVHTPLGTCLCMLVF